MLAGLRSAVQGFLVDLPETFSVDFGQTIQSVRLHGPQPTRVSSPKKTWP